MLARRVAASTGADRWALEYVGESEPVPKGRLKTTQDCALSYTQAELSKVAD